MWSPFQHCYLCLPSLWNPIDCMKGAWRQSAGMSWAAYLRGQHEAAISPGCLVSCQDSMQWSSYIAWEATLTGPAIASTRLSRALGLSDTFVCAASIPWAKVYCAGTTSQPTMGAIVNAVADTPLDTGIDPYDLTQLSTFWEHTRALYSPFEASMKSPSSDVYLHEMPGGMVSLRRTNLSHGSYGIYIIVSLVRCHSCVDHCMPSASGGELSDESDKFVYLSSQHAQTALQVVRSWQQSSWVTYKSNAGGHMDALWTADCICFGYAGQYTNLRFQAASLGLGNRWEKVKVAYAAANKALGDIVKVGSPHYNTWEYDAK